ncbi:tyrosine-type recombinase/integrase [Christiangramia portivictoriae]|uniref:tyrosine-type recombinase/integrase n=1 Tax=Christiangramia portivictoriae TaxID=326069 RepID=UPI0004252D88|nr:tyrosine-type recombinase/integrase [Christiangramia portivictoriae]
MPFQSFLDYLHLEKNYAATTIRAYKADLEQFQEFVQSEFSDEKIEKVSYNQIRNWIVQLSDSGISNQSINRKMSSLKAYYKFLLKTSVIESSPLAKHRSLKVSKKLQVPFSEKEMLAVLEELEENTFEGIRDRLMIELFYSTGIRRAELINIREQDLDLDNNMLKVLGKRNKERYIPLLEQVVLTAERYLKNKRSSSVLRDCPYLFVTAKGHKSYESLVYRIINNYFSKVSGKVKKSPHILRHTFATHLLNQGANMNAVKELLGHLSLASTQVYTHNSIAELSKIHKMSHPRSNNK